MNQLIKEAVTTVSVDMYVDSKVFLKQLYAFVKAKVPNYSYKKFSSDIGLGESTLLHQIIKGYRPLTVKTAKKIADGIRLEGQSLSYFMQLVAYETAKTSKSRDVAFEKLIALKEKSLVTDEDQDLLEYFSEWFHPVIREMVGLSGFKSDAKWIAEKIFPKIRPAQAMASLALLERLAYIAKDAEGSYSQTQKIVSTGHKLRGMGLLSYHQQMIDHGKESLTRIKAKRRNISAVTVSCSDEKAQKLKAMINLFTTQLLDEADKEEIKNKDQIYQVNIQLFPFTKK